ncbi:ABC transporter ATP-binding protein [Nitratireductor soli]|uniref:ABC transporter ATP-binding protein n=1 Tax=Nitratireductor soli TaxID=1670619 RepID=UPI00069E3795|nr:ABC transporter ATP-binding protein [Nitratireductor soli]
MHGNGVTVENLRKIYVTSEQIAGGIHAANFNLPEGTFFTLLGPSGCGKTTTLRCIAGLEQPDEGRIEVGGTTFFDADRGIAVPLNRRGIGMVFQSYAIWPHMTVFENVSFPLRVAKDRSYGREEIRALSEKALATVGLDQFADRSATRLSGGQQQRVALARAIVREPRLLLLDEPLSNLDASLRETMRQELKRLQRQIGVTTIYVTHDQAEAFEMSDQIAVIDKGHVVQIGAPESIYFRPKNIFVASFVGNTNLVRGIATGKSGNNAATTVRLPSGAAFRCLTTDGGALNGGSAVTVSIRPEAIAVGLVKAGASTTGNGLEGVISDVAFLGNMRRYEIRLDQTVITANSDPRQTLGIGDRVFARFDLEDAIVLAE